jgi:nucleotide-binding universal stress UspA family protein
MTDPPPQLRVLLVANRTCPCPGLLDFVADRAAGGQVHVVAPALNSRLRHYVSDTDASIAAARERLAQAAEGLASRLSSVSTAVGDGDPLVAIADALARFRADEIVIGTLPPGHSNWLEKGLVDKARARFALPVTHIATEYGLAEHVA